MKKNRKPIIDLNDVRFIDLKVQKKVYKVHYIYSGRKGTMDCKLYWYSKFYNQLILSVDPKTLDTFI